MGHQQTTRKFETHHRTTHPCPPLGVKPPWTSIMKFRTKAASGSKTTRETMVLPWHPPVACTARVYCCPDANNRVHVEYQVYTDGKWSAITKDGDKVTSAQSDKPITALRASLAPRNQRYIVYTTYPADAAGKQNKMEAKDNGILAMLQRTRTPSSSSGSRSISRTPLHGINTRRNRRP